MIKIENLKYLINGSTAVIGLLISQLLGGWDMALRILLTFVVLDYITGLAKSGYNGDLSSCIGWKGLLRKGAIFFVIIITHQVDMIAGVEAPIFRIAATYFYIANEAISITENVSALGVPLPNFLTQLLQVMKENASEGKPTPKGKNYEKD